MPLAFERHVTDLIISTEDGLPKRHLVAQRIANGSPLIPTASPAGLI